MASSIATSVLGALQASLSVLLTIFYGVLASQFGLLNEGAAKEISQTCVRMFLPALLVTNLGSQLHLDTGIRYVPVFLWALMYNAISVAIGILATKLLRLPSWVTPAVTFNNTTALPLLLVQALDTTGILEGLIVSGSDSSSDAVARAKSYFLVNAMVSNSLTFALGPSLLNGQEEDAPDKPGDKQDCDEESQQDPGANANGHQEHEEDVADERTSLLPNRVAEEGSRIQKNSSKKGQKWFHKLPPAAQTTLHFLYQFANAPLIGAVIGAIIGLAPPLHRLFFADTNSGGYLNAWLATSISNIGNLFASLQVIVVGVKLGSSLRKMKRGEASGSVPWKAMAFVTVIRYILWPVVSISLVWAMAKRTTVLSADPVLWFAMMLMPTGPPAMKLTALADVNGSGEWEKMSIAKFLTLSYAISPLICFAVVGSLKASEAVISSRSDTMS